MKCKHCFNLEKMKDYARSDVYDWCVVKHDNPDTDMERDCPYYKPTTNYDRIVSKTPEELASFLFSMIGCPMNELENFEHCTINDTIDDYCVPRECWLKWLKQEADEK